MKYLSIILVFLCSTVFAQFQTIGINGQNIKVNTGVSKDVIYAVTTKNQSAATYYTNWINLREYLDISQVNDSLSAFAFLRFKQVDDSVNCDIVLEGRYSAGDTSKPFTWLTVFTNFRGTSSDSVYNLVIRPNGTFIAPKTNLLLGSAIASANGILPDQVRIKFVQDAAASGGNNGYMKFWLLLQKPFPRTNQILQ